MLLSLVCGLLSSPVQVQLQSQLPSEPIEDPAAWAWGLHPDNGLDYSAKVIIYQRAIKTRIIPALISPPSQNGFTVELCLQKPELIATAKCKLPLDVCLANPEYIALPGCLGNSFTVGMCQTGTR